MIVMMYISSLDLISDAINLLSLLEWFNCVILNPPSNTILNQSTN